MTAKASPTKQDLPPLEFEPLRFIPIGDVKELPPSVAWPLWDAAVEEMDREAA